MDQPRGDGGLPERATGPRASDDDRLVVVTRLREAAGEGLIDLDELEQRIAAAYEARTLPDLVPITADLPAPRNPPVPPPKSADTKPVLEAIFGQAMQSPGFQHHLTVYLLTIGMLIGIWALAGAGHFWPFYPAAGWGIGLGSHWMAAKSGRERVDHRYERALDHAERRDEQLRRRNERHQDRHRHLPPPMPGMPPAPAGSTIPPATPAPTAQAPATAIGGDVPVRRFVVAMFVDVVNSTRLNEALGDEQWSSLRRATRRTIDEAVTAQGGWEANTSGDGVLARFEHPAAAAGAAIEILRTLDRQRGSTGFAPSVRVGIHSGDAVDEDGDIIGNVVNLAARVTGAADPDEILVTEHVADHLGPGQHAEGRGLHSLKGIERPRHLLSLRWQ